MDPRLAAFAAALLLAAAPAAAQNSAAAPPPRTGPPGTAAPPTTAPPPGMQPPPATTPPPVVVVPEPEPTANVVIVQPVQTVPDEPLTISPDAAYPNGFADPADPFGNDLSLARREETGFPWGLLGLLGLLGLFGLIPLFRRGGRTTRTVYVDRDDPKRVIREDRIGE